MNHRNSVTVASGVSSSVRGLESCPNPCIDERVLFVMSFWGRWQWSNRAEDSGLGFPTVNVISPYHGLGVPVDDCEWLESEVGSIIETVNSLLKVMGPVAEAFALATWVRPSSQGIKGVTDRVDRYLDCDVKRIDSERWVSAISGAVIATMGDFDCLSDVK